MVDLFSKASLEEDDSLRIKVERFVLFHTKLHRPICLVSSGGTAADLEAQAVRSLENFSTGLRGSIAVEELLRRGYAVIHLWRTGSASPFARVLSQYLGLKQANYGLDVESLGKLFSIPGADTEDDLVKTVLQQETDPWFSDNGEVDATISERKNREDLTLNRGLLYSTRVQKSLHDRSVALSEGRLITVSFRTVEDYLSRLQLCSEILEMSKSLTMIVLAAAVSDFYIPKGERAEHKLQSASNEGHLTLTLSPVPKVMGLLRKSWAPSAFVVSFKLETDLDILREKAEKAVSNYGCHLVIGNILQTRHETIWILAPSDQREQSPTSAKDWTFREIVKSRGDDCDSLEISFADFIVQSHFEFISWHFHADGYDTELVAKRQADMLQRRQRIQRAQSIAKVKNVCLEIAGTLLAFAISYSINSALQRRLRH